MAPPPDPEVRWPAETVIAEVRRRVEALAEELQARFADSHEAANPLLREHAWRYERVLAEVLAEASWAEEDYWATLAEHLERHGGTSPRE
jgi:hypothetical protein